MVSQGKKHSLSAIRHLEGRARALLMLSWMLLVLLMLFTSDPYPSLTPNARSEPALT